VALKMFRENSKDEEEYDEDSSDYKLSDVEDF